MGKYQKILAKEQLSCEDLLTLQAAGKLKPTGTPIVIVKHAGETYLKLVDKNTLEYLERMAAGV